MAIKTNKKTSRGKVIYESNKIIITAEDKLKADKEYSELEKIINKVERILSRQGFLAKDAKKKDALVVWHTIGEELDEYLNKKRMNKDEEKLFWDTLYGRWPKIHGGLPKFKVDLTRNDFKTARELAKFDLNELKKVGSWGLWREIISYKRIYSDPRIIEWIVEELTKKPRTRDESRPLLKAISNRFKKIDTTILTKEELYTKLSEIKIVEEPGNT